jgi:hypothetical protein
MPRSMAFRGLRMASYSSLENIIMCFLPVQRSSWELRTVPCWSR